MNRILIAEDEPRITAFLEKGLRSHGFTTTVAPDGRAAADMADDEAFDLLILDLGLPEKNGWEVLEELRGQGQQLPIIILTAYKDERDVVAGLEAGADDYITKPFRIAELVARMRVQLRKNRAPSVREEMELTAGNLSLDLRTRQMRVGDRPVELSTRELLLAETFLRHPGQVMTREQLLNRVWGYDYDPGSNIVDVYVGYLRKKLGSQTIETVRGMGYRLR
ncbi:MAG: response regulator transcription factor [Geitlerinemataceae cyanobacterium]